MCCHRSIPRWPIAIKPGRWRLALKTISRRSQDRIGNFHVHRRGLSPTRSLPVLVSFGRRPQLTIRNFDLALIPNSRLLRVVPTLIGGRAQFGSGPIGVRPSRLAPTRVSRIPIRSALIQIGGGLLRIVPILTVAGGKTQSPIGHFEMGRRTALTFVDWHVWVIPSVPVLL